MGLVKNPPGLIGTRRTEKYTDEIVFITDSPMP